MGMVIFCANSMPNLITRSS